MVGLAAGEHGVGGGTAGRPGRVAVAVSLLGLAAGAGALVLATHSLPHSARGREWVGFLVIPKPAAAAADMRMDGYSAINVAA